MANNTYSLDSGQRFAEASVLVVDDHELNVETIKGILGNLHNVGSVNSGAAALEFCNSTAPDLIILDVVMNDMDGLETCRRLKKDQSLADIPVIFVTGSRDSADEDECWDAGCVDFLLKPVNAKTLINRVKAHLTLKFQADLLRQLAYLDGLTGVFNRRYFDDQLKRQLAQTNRTGEPSCLVLLDIDYFKKYNDHYGHLAGDDCLRRVGQHLNNTLKRPLDTIARYGGEEFAMILPATPIDGALRLAESIVTDTADLGIPHVQSPYSVITISLGVAELQPGSESSREALDRADRALYQAKESGRNCLSAARSPD